MADTSNPPAPPAPVIRAYDPADRDQVMAMAPRLTEGIAPWRDPAGVLTAAQGWVRGSLDADGQADHAAFVADDDGVVTGILTVREQAHFSGEIDAYVSELIVRAGRERRGIARQLMAAAEAWAASRGLSFLTLDTGAANETARRFYAAVGFQEEEVRLTKAVRPEAAR